MEVIFKSQYNSEKVCDVEEFLIPAVPGSHGLGQTETMQAEIELLNQTVARLLTKLVSLGSITVKEASDIIGDDYEIVKVEL